MAISIKRVYEQPTPQDGYRILIDRLWPRGLSREKAKIDEWIKDVAPSEELRKAFHLEEVRWEEFEKKYLLELEKYREKLKSLLKLHRNKKITLLYSYKDTEKNNAIVLKQFLTKLESEN